MYANMLITNMHPMTTNMEQLKKIELQFLRIKCARDLGFRVYACLHAWV
jgi:hypothetical protein